METIVPHETKFSADTGGTPMTHWLVSLTRFSCACGFLKIGLWKTSFKMRGHLAWWELAAGDGHRPDATESAQRAGCHILPLQGQMQVCVFLHPRKNNSVIHDSAKSPGSHRPDAREFGGHRPPLQNYS